MTCNYLPNIGKGRNRVSSFFYASTFSLLMVAFACTPAAADPVVQITQCGTVISQPGHYVLANDISCTTGPVAPTTTTGAPNVLAAWGPLHSFDGSTMVVPTAPSCNSADGIDIVSDHVDLALDGHTISGCGNATGIAVGVGPTPGNSHVHIIGPGTITGFSTGLVFLQVDHSSVSEVTATGDGFSSFVIAGIAPGCAPACFSTKNDFQGNTASNSAFGFFLQGANDNTLSGNSVSDTGLFAAGITVAFGTGNDIRGNNVTRSFGGIVVGVFDGPGVATDNDILHNTAQGNFFVDLFDGNPNCDSDTWKHNVFNTANQACIQ